MIGALSLGLALGLAPDPISSATDSEIWLACSILIVGIASALRDALRA